MKRDYITFRSITPAQQGQNVLRRGGVETLLQRTPRWMEQQGCGYCLRLRPEQRDLALMLLRQAGVDYQKVYTSDARELEEAEK